MWPGDALYVLVVPTARGVNFLTAIARGLCLALAVARGLYLAIAVSRGGGGVNSPSCKRERRMRHTKCSRSPGGRKGAQRDKSSGGVRKISVMAG